MHAPGTDLATSPWGPARAWLILLGLVSWLGGVDFMLLNVFDDARFLTGWLISGAGLATAVITLLSAVVWRRPVRWSFPGTLLAVPRTAGVPARVCFAGLALLGAAVPILMAVLLLRLSLP